MTLFAKRYGPWALVTGASSGIGAEFAGQLAQRGLNLILVARRADRLTAYATQLSDQYGIEIITVPVDLADSSCLDTVQSAIGMREVGLLINNAGFSVTGPFTSNNVQREIQMLDVNCRAPLMFSHHFAPQMFSRGHGGIIFVASSVAYSPVPFWSHYAATKAYVRFVAEGLWHEFRPHGVDVLAVCPGATITEFQETADIQVAPGAMTAQAVVFQALRAFGRTPVFIPGLSNRLMAHLLTLLPERAVLALWAKIIKKIQRIPNRAIAQPRRREDRETPRPSRRR